MQISSDSDDAKTFFDFAPAVVYLGAGLVAFVGGPVAFSLERLPGPRTLPRRSIAMFWVALGVVLSALIITSGVACIVGQASAPWNGRAPSQRLK